MLCQSCGYENAVSSRFCLNCGRRFGLECSQCAKSLPTTARFCDDCGIPVASAAENAVTIENSAGPSSEALPVMFKGGRYMVSEFLGEGVRKKVYLVHDTLIDRDVAFTLIKTEGLDEVARERILREAQAMGRLSEHPHIVQIHDFGDENGQPYMVVSVMAGGSVDDLIRRAPGGCLDTETIVRVTRDVFKGLEHAHSMGIVHRDLKPGNVWLTADGVAKIGDFGIALSLDYSRLTQEGMMVGTMAYIPPESAKGGQVDERSDLYSLGCMLYVMATGTPPFLGDNPAAIIGQHINTPPVPPTWRNPHCPASLEALILQLLGKDPAERPQSAAAVSTSLEALDITHTEEPLVQALLADRFVTAEQLELARGSSQERGGCLLESLLSLGMVSRQTLATLLSFSQQVPVVDLEAVAIASEVLELVPREFAHQLGILPIEFLPDGRYRVATMSLHRDNGLGERLASMVGRQVEFALVLNEEGLDEFIQHAYAQSGERAQSGGEEE